MDNMAEVVHQMQAFGIEFAPRDLPLMVGMAKRKTCGKKGKFWYWLQEFRPRTGGAFVVGKFGSYKTSESQKVEVDWKPLGEAERERMAAEQQRARERADVARAEQAEIAAMNAIDLWRRAAHEGHSPYLARKGVVGEACRYLPDGTLVLPLLRYDLPRTEALRAVQRILPDGAKYFTRGFAKPGCALRLGGHDDSEECLLVLVCEGYATGLTLRMATDRTLPVYVALDAGNLAHVVPLVAGLYPECRVLICADDDHLTRDHDGVLNNPGRSAARAIAKQVTSCDFVWPVFDATRRPGDTDFNDLHLRQGLDAVARQLGSVIRAIRGQR